MNNSQSQFDRVIEHKDGEDFQVEDPDAPIMPFPTSFRLTREQEKEIVDFAMTRKEELETESGREACGGDFLTGVSGIASPDPLGIDAPHKTWMGKRILYDKTFKNEMEWRPGIMGGIFLKSNLSVTVARDICRKMIARGISFFFGTSPWFAAYPVGAMDKALADKADRYTRWKMEGADLQEVQEDAIERAFVVGECVVKTSWAQRSQIYETTAEVMVDAEGRDILGDNGDYITKKDLWIQDATVDPTTGESVMAELMVLKRDGVTPQPEELIWQEKLITREIIHYKGPEAETIHFLDFLCGLTEKSVQKADCCIHLYDLPLMELADQYKKSAAARATIEERVKMTRDAVELLRKLEVGDGQQTSGQNSEAVDSSTPSIRNNARSKAMVHIAEFHLRYDIDNRGLRDIILVIDTRTRTPIFYDYTANTTGDGMRPFTVIRPVKVPGRWYGCGAMELMNPSQEILDLWFNRKNLSVSGSGRVDFWNKDLTKEGAANPHLRMNWGGTYTPKDTSTTADQILSSVYLTDTIGDKLMEMMEFTIQIMQNGSGVTSANDAQAANMDTSATATGVRHLEKSGQELFARFIGPLDSGVTEVLKKMVKIMFVNLDPKEIYRYFEEGEAVMDPVTGIVDVGEGGGQLVEIDPTDIANLEMDVKVILGKHRGEQILESSSRIVELVEKFYAFSPQIQMTVAPTFVEMGKALMATDAKKLFTPMSQPVGPTGQPLDAAGMANAAPKNPRQSEPNL